MSVQIKPIVAAGFTLDNLPLCITEVLGLALFTLPILVEKRDILYHGSLYQTIKLNPDESQSWNVYESKQFTAWIEGEEICIQYGPYDMHKVRYALTEFRLALWNALGETIPFLKPGENFLTALDHADYPGLYKHATLYQIRPIVIGEINHIIVVDSGSAEVIECEVVENGGVKQLGDSAKVLSYELCHANVSIASHPNFKTNAFTTSTFVGGYTKVSENFKQIGNTAVYLEA